MNLVDEINARRLVSREIAAQQIENRGRHVVGLYGYKGDNSSVSPSPSLSLSLDDLKLLPYKGNTLHKYTKIYTGLEPSKLLGRVYDYFASVEVECTISQEFYELSTSVVTDQDNLELKLRVYQEDKHFILDTKLIQGNNLDLMKLMREIQLVIYHDEAKINH